MSPAASAAICRIRFSLPISPAFVCQETVLCFRQSACHISDSEAQENEERHKLLPCEPSCGWPGCRDLLCASESRPANRPALDPRKGESYSSLQVCYPSIYSFIYMILRSTTRDCMGRWPTQALITLSSFLNYTGDVQVGVLRAGDVVYSLHFHSHSYLHRTLCGNHLSY